MIKFSNYESFILLAHFPTLKNGDDFRGLSEVNTQNKLAISAIILENYFIKTLFFLGLILIGTHCHLIIYFFFLLSGKPEVELKLLKAKPVPFHLFLFIFFFVYTWHIS